MRGSNPCRRCLFCMDLQALSPDLGGRRRRSRTLCRVCAGCRTYFSLSSNDCLTGSLPRGSLGLPRMKFEFHDITQKARRSRRELRGVVVVLLLLGCSTHLAFAHSTISLPPTPTQAMPAEPITIVVAEAEPGVEPLSMAHEPSAWMPQSRRGCRGSSRCNPHRRVPQPSAKVAERAATIMPRARC